MKNLYGSQVFAIGLLYLGMNTAGLFIHYLTDHVQRQVFLETRRCIEGRLKLEQENQRQVLLQLLSATELQLLFKMLFCLDYAGYNIHCQIIFLFCHPGASGAVNPASLCCLGDDS